MARIDADYQHKDGWTPPALIQPKEITITRAEGPTRLVGKPVVARNYLEADIELRRIAQTAPDCGAYDKTDFRIVFEDGMVYEGRFDAQRQHTTKHDLLRAHVRSFQEFEAGLHRPRHLTEEQWTGVCRNNESDGSAARAREFLAKYDVGQGDL